MKDLDSILHYKKEERKRIKSILKELSDNLELCKAQSDSLCQKIISSELYKKSSLILAYMPLKTEISPLGLIKKALEDKKSIALPKVLSDGIMEFYFLDSSKSLEEQLCSGAFGILEPETSLELFVPEKDESHFPFVIVPALLFAKDGCRLGKGGGFYDRYLQRLINCGWKKNQFCAFAYDVQFVEKVPVEKSDVKVDVSFLL